MGSTIRIDRIECKIPAMPSFPFYSIFQIVRSIRSLRMLSRPNPASRYPATSKVAVFPFVLCRASSGDVVDLVSALTELRALKQ